MIPPYDQTGLPFYWQYEGSGKLAMAIAAYVERVADQSQLILIKEYFAHWVHAPVYDENEFHTDETRATLSELRAAIAHCEPDQTALENWQMAALKEGIDPL